MSSTQRIPSAARPGRASTGSGPPSSSLSTPPKIDGDAAVQRRGQLATERERAAVVGRDDDHLRVLVGGDLRHLRGRDGARQHDHLRARARQLARERVADHVVDLERGEHDAQPVEPRQRAPRAFGDAGDDAVLPGLERAQLARSGDADARLELRRRAAAQRQQQRGSVGDVDAAVAQPSEHAVPERAGVGGGLGGAPLDPRPVQQRGAAAHLALERARDQLHLQHLGGGRDPLGLAQRHRVDRVARRAVQLRGDVGHHRGREHLEVALAVAAVLDGVAVDHRAERVAVAQVVEREPDDRAVRRVGDEPAVAVREPGADQVLDRVAARAPPSRGSRRSG